jgi:tight adherence protein B
MTLLFLASFLSAAASGCLLFLWRERRETANTLRRLNAPKLVDASQRRPAGPRLIDTADEVRGRLAAGLLDRLRLKAAAERLLERAALKWGAVGLLHRSAALFLAVFAAVTLASGNRLPLAALAAASVAALLPLAYARRSAAARLRKFEEQFPEALEFLSRSMRAGHAFSVALDLVHREFPDPLASEFRRAFEEQNLGQPIDIVLRKLTERVPSMDVRFFAAAVVLQKRTGGNLAELLDKLAYIIRERFKLRARIRAVSAQGLMSGRILASIPLAVALLMFVVNPNYARFFVADPAGHQLLAVGLGLQLVGYAIIRKIVAIEV